MNKMNSSCRKCQAPMMVSQKEWFHPSAHICVTCTKEEIDEFNLSEEELNFCNDYTVYDDEPATYTEPTCTCGAVKAGTPFHSDWCDLMIARKKKAIITDEEEII